MRPREFSPYCQVVGMKYRQSYQASNVGDAFNGPGGWHVRYEKLVEWYSGCGLTKSSDKLPALAGIHRSYRLVWGEVLPWYWLQQ